MGRWRDNLLKVANIVGCLGFLGSNIYIYVSSGGVYHSGKETYFTPSPYVFLIWPIIHFLMLGCIVYQFTEEGKKKLIDGCGWWFPLWTVLSMAYVHSWAQGHYAAALLFALLLVIMPVIIVGTVDSGNRDNGGLWVLILIFVYFSWALFLFVLSSFDTFGVDASTQPAGVFTKMFVFFCLWLIEFLPSLGALDASTQGATILLSVPVTCVLFAIFEHQRSSEFVHWTALVFAISAFGALLKNSYMIVRSIRNDTPLPDPERAPLIAGN